MCDIIDLSEKYKDDDVLIEKINNLNLLSEHPKFKKGQTIEFWGGYDGDIRYRSTITGFDKDFNIYLLWDCFWFPIKDNKEREIKIC